ncbi:MAG TPA: hypothetical protein VJP81_07465 [Candidatus Dormibacteraeota bacterium]|nr:hypothetical protein [Candidatus Dormibacteraeota bacterium]
MPLHAALFFGALSLATTAVALWPGLIRARFWIGLPVGAALIAVNAWTASLSSGQPNLYFQLAVDVIGVTVAIRIGMLRWSWLGAHLFAAAALVSIAHLIYAATVTYAVASDPVDPSHLPRVAIQVPA